MASAWTVNSHKNRSWFPTCHNRLEVPINLNSVTQSAHVSSFAAASDSNSWKIKIRAAHKRFKVPRSLIHISRVWRPRRFPFRNKWVRETERKTDYAFVWRVHRMRSINVSTKNEKKQNPKRNNSTTQYWQLKICFRIKRNEKKNFFVFLAFPSRVYAVWNNGGGGEARWEFEAKLNH